MENIGIRQSEDSAGYVAMKATAAVVDLPRTILRLTGKDPVGMLDAILTNEVPQDGNAGAYAALLNPKGRIQTDLRVLKGEAGILVDTEPEGADAAKEILGRYATFSRVRLEDLSSGEDPWTVLGLYGPRAQNLLGDPALAEHETADTSIGGATLLAAGVSVPIPGYDLIGPSSTLHTVREHLTETSAVPADLRAYETARVAAGVPRFGADLTPDNFPGESRVFLDRAVSFTKGCYPGQETVARMRYRGSPNKRLYLLELDAPQPEPGDEILQNDEHPSGARSAADVVGWISSIAPLYIEGRVLALGYLSRKADDSSPMTVQGATVQPHRMV